MMIKSPAKLADFYSFPGFKAKNRMTGVFGDRYSRVIHLERRKKQPFVHAVDTNALADMTSMCTERGICQSPDGGYIWNLSGGEFIAQGVEKCA